MARIRIDLGDLEMAFSGGDGTEHWFMDRQTGEVIFASDDTMGYSGGFEDEDGEDEAESDVPEDPEQVWALIERHPDRYLAIPSLSSHDGFRMMERFVGSLEPGPARRALAEALQRRRPFRSFKDALAGYPAIREAWFKYEQQHLRHEAMDWLKSQGIDAELVPFIDRSAPEPGA